MDETQSGEGAFWRLMRPVLMWSLLLCVAGVAIFVWHGERVRKIRSKCIYAHTRAEDFGRYVIQMSAERVSLCGEYPEEEDQGDRGVPSVVRHK